MEKIIVFEDIQPKAPIHKLIIPRKTHRNSNDGCQEDTELLGHLLYTAKQLAKQDGIVRGRLSLDNELQRKSRASCFSSAPTSIRWPNHELAPGLRIHVGNRKRIYQNYSKKPIGEDVKTRRFTQHSKKSCCRF